MSGSTSDWLSHSITVSPGPAPTISRSSVISRSPIAASAVICASHGISDPWVGTHDSSTPCSVNTTGDAGSSIAVRSIKSAPDSAFASMIAARNVQAPASVSHMPSPGDLSIASSGLLTENVAALAVAARDKAANIQHDTRMLRFHLMVFLLVSLQTNRKKRC